MSFDFDEFDELISAEILPNRNNSEGFASDFPQDFASMPIFSVSDFVAVSNDIFEKTLPSVLIEGEISSFKVNQNKFVFFDLKDEKSSLGCFMSVWQMRFPLEDGMKVVAKVQPKLTDWGKFSLTVQQIIPRGEGNLKRSFDILKHKLEKEGLFSLDKKRKISKNPSRLAVISSVQAAGYADFIKIINERWGGIDILVAHTQVQGVAASDQIVAAIDFFNQQEVLPEVIAIVRGGGSTDDLMAFNDEKLVRAIAKSRIPIITGIGHETDQVLADLAADLAASTPSNAAQLLTNDKRAVLLAIDQRIRRQSVLISDLMANQRKISSSKLAQIKSKIISKINQQRFENQARTRLIARYDPSFALKNGYAIIRGEIEIGGEIDLETYDKIIKAEVKNVRTK